MSCECEDTAAADKMDNQTYATVNRWDEFGNWYPKKVYDNCGTCPHCGRCSNCGGVVCPCCNRCKSCNGGWYISYYPSGITWWESTGGNNCQTTMRLMIN